MQHGASDEVFIVSRGDCSGDFDPFGARQGEFEWWMMIVMIVMNVGKMMVIV